MSDSKQSVPVGDGGPAFPSPTGNPMQDGQVTVRDYFAASALQGMLSNGFVPAMVSAYGGDFNYARFAYMMADAMLKARAR